MYWIDARDSAQSAVWRVAVARSQYAGLPHDYYAPFTPLQEWQQRLELLSCLPEDVRIPGVGECAMRGMFNWYFLDK